MPVVSAGGVASGEGIASMLALGAEGVSISEHATLPALKRE